MHQDVVHEPAVIVQEAGVMRLAELELRYRIGSDEIGQPRRFGSADLDLAHVADIEQPGRRSHGIVFVDNAGVLHRHVPPAEIHHLGAERTVQAVQWRRTQGRGCGHGSFRLTAPD
jgi:hypothetical protein